MKLFDIDWLDFLELLPLWERLSLKVRGAFAELRSDNPLARSAFDGQDRLLVQAGLVGYSDNLQKVRLEKAGFSFARVIRAMMRHDILKSSDPDALTRYLGDHYSNEELKSLDASAYYPHSGWRQYIAQRVIAVEWIEEILSRKEETKEESLAFKPWPSWLTFPRVRSHPAKSSETLVVEQTLIRRLMTLTDPLPLRDLVKTFPDVAPRTLADALLQGIGEVAVFPAMRREDMTPVIGLWPAISRRLHRPPAKPPEPVQPQESFHGAFLLEDMTTLLVAAASGPLRLRGNDYALFAKAQKELEANLMPLFDWVAGAWKIHPRERLHTAMLWLQDLGLARNEGIPGEDLRFQPTPQGEAWLAASSKQRLKTILDYLGNANAKKTPGGVAEICNDFVAAYEDRDDFEDDDYYNPYAYSGYARRFDFLPFRLESTDRKDYDAVFRKAIVSAFASLPENEFLLLDAFLRWHCEAKNPLAELALQSQKPRFYGPWGSRKPTREDLDELWTRLLKEFFVNRLLNLGGTRFGLLGARGDVCFALTDIGRYLLGLQADFEYCPGVDSQGKAVVQPNFEIVLLARAPGRSRHRPFCRTKNPWTWRCSPSPRKRLSRPPAAG